MQMDCAKSSNKCNSVFLNNNIDTYHDQIFYVLPERKLSIEGYIKSLAAKKPFPDRGVAGISESDPSHPINHLKHLLTDIEETAQKSILYKRKLRKKNKKTKFEIANQNKTDLLNNNFLKNGDDSQNLIDHTQFEETNAEFSIQTLNELIKSKIKTEKTSLPETEFNKNKINIEEIKKLKHFSNYNPGNPSNVLYIKNLPSKLTQSDLVHIFGCFEESNKEAIVYRLMNGRMRGQAFVRFSNLETAKQVFEMVNGYVFKEKPIVIEFAKQTAKY